MHSSPKAIALHGFLGLPSDWSRVAPGVDAVDLWSSAQGSADGALERWAQVFTRDLRAKNFREPATLVGYSMGGRLAMHAICAAPELFSRAVIVSAHPGLRDDGERGIRLENDQRWASRFRHDPWEVLMRDWNAQAVLRRLHPRSQDELLLERVEPDFSREALAYALEAWSLGRQEDLRERCLAARVPMTLVSGAEDSKFASLLEEFAQSAKRHGSQVDHHVIAGAGHRVPWEKPRQFLEAIAWPPR